MRHLTKAKWVVVKAAKTHCIPLSELTDDHIHVDMIMRIKLDEECIWLVPLSSLVKPCFVIYNKNYGGITNDDGQYGDDTTAYIVKPMKDWPDLFL